MSEFALSSPAFDDGERIPERYGRDAADVSPPLTVTGVPDGAASLALVMDDPDAVEPAGKVWDHWVVWNVPPDADFPAGWDAGAAGATAGTNDFGETGYGGPAPPDREHTYRFRLFALDTTLDLPAAASAADVEEAMTGHVLAEARLAGTYAP